MVAPPSPCMSMIQSAPHRFCRAKASGSSRNATSRGESLPEGHASACRGRAEARPSIRLRPTPAASASAKPGTTPLPAQPEVPSSAALSASDRLLKEANVLRERGDTANALARLQDASQRDPKNPQVLAEMAALYESIQLYDRSNET